ncbi:MAG: prolyl oligopeptidase family serine peptidase [bacterium]|nr:prolyl oligopeptidase family serine peptidase [bacterium]
MAESIPTTPGVHKCVLPLPSQGSSDRAALRYTLSLPANFSPKTAVPVVIALHYGGKVTPYYGGGYLEALPLPALQGLGAVMAAPDCPGNGWNNPAGEAAVLALIEHLQIHYTIDTGKIVLTGFSMGGIGTWYLASRHPRLFAVAVPVASFPDTGNIAPESAIPFYAVNSNGDRIFPIEKVKPVIKKLKEKGFNIQFKILDGIDHYNTNRFVPALRESVPWIRENWK